MLKYEYSQEKVNFKRSQKSSEIFVFCSSATKVYYKIYDATVFLKPLYLYRGKHTQAYHILMKICCHVVMR